MKKALGVLSLGVLLVAATPTAFGGWAVVTFEDVPAHLTVNQPTTFTFKIRQHGQTLVNDRSPSLSLKDAESGFIAGLFNRNSFSATRTQNDGEYQATVTPTEIGKVKVVVDTDVFGWKTRLIPIPVYAENERVAPVALEDRGRQLFAAKGCAMCHAKFDEPAFEGWRLIQVGPDLTARSFPSEWLADKIRSPDQFAPATGVDKMPTLGVSDEQITALVTYINGTQSTTVTQAIGIHSNGS